MEPRLEPLHVVVPVRSVEGGKARLGAVLDAEEREALIAGMLRHTLAEIAAWGGAAQTMVVTLDETLLEIARSDDAIGFRQRQPGLNEAITEARKHVVAAGAAAMLILPGDLPWLAAASLVRLLDAADAALAAGSGGPVVVVAPADARNGTNALLLAPPWIIEPAFGHGSLEAHVRAAAEADASVQVVVDPGFGFDLDTPDDLQRLDERRLDHLVRLGSAAFSTL